MTTHLAVTRISKLSLLAVLVAACSGRPASAQTSTANADEWIAQIEQGLVPEILLEGEGPMRWSLVDRMQHYGVPGLSVAVIENGEIAWAHGWGVADTETGAPVSTETLFQAASVSKPVAALAALTLVEEGQLSLDRPVNEFLKTWTVPENEFTADSAVTLRGILTHSAGFTVSGFPGYPRNEPFTTGHALATNAEVLDGEGNTESVRVYKVPGTSFQYSGGGYTVMELLLKDVTGLSFPDVVADRVFGPAGMSLSTVEQPLPEARWLEASRAHGRDGSEIQGGWHNYPEQAAAGLWTTPTELARLGVHLLRILEGEERNGVVSGATLNQMLSPNRGAAEGFDNYGFGFGLTPIEGHRVFGHSGANEGFRAYWQMYPVLGIGYAVMTNGDRGVSLTREVLRAIAVARDWPIHQPEIRARVRLDASDIEPLLGEYAVAEGRPNLVLAIGRGEDATLSIVPPGQPAQTFYSASADEWFELNGNEIAFERDEEGPVVGAVINGSIRFSRGVVDDPEPSGLTTEDIARYEGTYAMDVGGQTLDATVFGENGELMAQLTGQGPQPLRRVGEDEFVLVAAPDIRAVFTVKGGRAESLTLHQGGQTFTGVRKP